MKKCSNCHEIKDLSFFKRNKARYDGLNNNCAICEKTRRRLYHLNNKEKENAKNRDRQRMLYRGEWYQRNKKRILEKARIRNKKNPEKHRNWLLKNKYGISLEQYNQLLLDQKGGCAICGRIEISVDKRNGKIKSLSVDHDHRTGRVRGLLCQAHNRALGMFHDNINELESAIEYLKT